MSCWSVSESAGERAAITLRVRLLHTASLHASGAGRLCAAADHLPRETHVGGRAARLHVVEQDRLAVARRLGQAHVAWNCGLEDLFLEEFPDVPSDLLRQIRAL